MYHVEYLSIFNWVLFRASVLDKDLMPYCLLCHYSWLKQELYTVGKLVGCLRWLIKYLFQCSLGQIALNTVLCNQSKCNTNDIRMRYDYSTSLFNWGRRTKKMLRTFGNNCNQMPEKTCTLFLGLAKVIIGLEINCIDG